MINGESDSERFEALSRELLNKGLTVRFEARGASMSPCIRDGEIVHVTAVIVSKLRKGDIVLTKGHSGFRVHRLVLIDHDRIFSLREAIADSKTILRCAPTKSWALFSPKK
jgi:hypothetical protein